MNYRKTKIFFFITAIIVFLSFPFAASAFSNLGQNQDHSLDSLTVGITSHLAQTLFAGGNQIVGTTTSMVLWVHNHSASSRTFSIGRTTNTGSSGFCSATAFTVAGNYNAEYTATCTNSTINYISTSTTDFYFDIGEFDGNTDLSFGGSATTSGDLYPAGDCRIYTTGTNKCNGIKDVYFVMNGDYSRVPASSVNDVSTRIVDFTPEEGDQLPSATAVHFSMTAYVNPADIGTFIGVKFSLHNIDQNVLLLSSFSPNDIDFLDGFSATTSGFFNYSTTTVIADGNYRINAVLERSYLSGWFVNPFSPINQDLSHQFIVGSSTFIGNISQNGFNELQAILGNTAATSTAAAAKSCNPLGGEISTFFLSNNFDPIKCLTFLLIPGGDYLNTSLKGLKDGVLTRVPWGYVTRLYDIWNTSATTTLPSFVATIQIGPGNTSSPDTTSLSFNPDDMISGGATLLESVKDPYNNKSARDVFEPFVQLSLAIATLFTIVHDLTGIHKHQKYENQGQPNKKLS